MAMPYMPITIGTGRRRSPMKRNPNPCQGQSRKIANMSPQPTPIAWEHAGSTDASMWDWTTTHFRATVTTIAFGGTRQFQWALQDRSSETGEWTIAEGILPTFADATNAAVEYAIKSYPHGGYAHYGPELAATYTLYGGQRSSLLHMHGHQVTLTYLDGERKTIRGRLTTGGHELHVHGDDVTWRIRPETVTNIAPQGRAGGGF